MLAQKEEMLFSTVLPDYLTGGEFTLHLWEYPEATHTVTECNWNCWKEQKWLLTLSTPLPWWLPPGTALTSACRSLRSETKNIMLSSNSITKLSSIINNNFQQQIAYSVQRTPHKCFEVNFLLSKTHWGLNIFHSTLQLSEGKEWEKLLTTNPQALISPRNHKTKGFPAPSYLKLGCLLFSFLRNCCERSC